MCEVSGSWIFPAAFIGNKPVLDFVHLSQYTAEQFHPSVSSTSRSWNFLASLPRGRHFVFRRQSEGSCSVDLAIAMMHVLVNSALCRDQHDMLVISSVPDEGSFNCEAIAASENGLNPSVIAITWKIQISWGYVMGYSKKPMTHDLSWKYPSDGQFQCNKNTWFTMKFSGSPSSHKPTCLKANEHNHR